MLRGFLQNYWEIFCKNTENYSVKILGDAQQKKLKIMLKNCKFFVKTQELGTW